MPETRQEQIARWEREGWLDPACPGCAYIYRATGHLPTEVAMGPHHDPSPCCRSGKRPHCTCDTCF